MVAVPMRERDAPDGSAGLRSSLEQSVAAPRDARVDESEAVVLAHEERVHETQPRELDQIWSYLTHTHGGRNLHPSPARGGSKQMMLCLCCLLGAS